MKKLALLISTIALFTACNQGDPKCISFNEDNYEKQIQKGTDEDLYTDAERIMLSVYFMQYAIVHDTEMDDPFVETMRKAAIDGGFKEHTNTCDVLAETRKKLEEEGITEEEYVDGMKDVFQF